MQKGDKKLSLMDIQIEIAKKHAKYFREIDRYMKIIKEAAKDILGEDTEVYLFGSALKGGYTPGASDIDVLVVSRNTPLSISGKSKIKAKIFEKIGDFFAPFEIHLVSPEEFKIYSNFIDEKKKI